MRLVSTLVVLIFWLQSRGHYNRPAIVVSGAYAPESYMTVTRADRVLKWLLPSEHSKKQVSRAQDSKKAYYNYLHNCGLKTGFLMKYTFRSQSFLEIPDSGLSSYPPSAMLWSTSVSQRGAFTCILWPSFCDWSPVDSPWSPGSKGQRILFLQDPRTIAFRETVHDWSKLEGTAQIEDWNVPVGFLRKRLV